MWIWYKWIFIPNYIQIIFIFAPFQFKTVHRKAQNNIEHEYWKFCIVPFLSGLHLSPGSPCPYSQGICLPNFKILKIGSAKYNLSVEAAPANLFFSCPANSSIGDLVTVWLTHCTMGFHITFQEMEHFFFKLILWLQFSSKIVETFFTW